MKLRALASLVVASSVFAFAGSAAAQAPDTSRVMGLRFEATLFNPFDVRGVSLSQGGDPVSPSRLDVVRPQGDIRIGYDLPMGLTPIIGFGLRSHSLDFYDSRDELTEGSGRTDIVLAAELRYYFGAHKRGLQPFGFGEWNTTIASFGSSFADSVDDEIVDGAKDRDAYLGDSNSIMNFGAGLGMEYKFARSFAIGAKWGLLVSLAPTERHEWEETNFAGELETVTEDASSNTVWGTSSSIYAAFRI